MAAPISKSELINVKDFMSEWSSVLQEIDFKESEVSSVLQYTKKQMSAKDTIVKELAEVCG